MDEANFFFLFAPSRVARLKKLFEGKGWHVEVKFQDPELAYEGAYSYVSSNRLPKVATEFETNSVEYQDLWEPFLERLEFVEFKHRFDSEKDKPAFDYRHVCNLWLHWHDKYADAAHVPRHMVMPQLQ